MTLYNPRHTNTTQLLNNEINLKIVSEHLGHADIQLTANVYIGVLDSSKIKIASVTEDILSGKNTK